jgi:hypothetical protein
MRAKRVYLNEQTLCALDLLGLDKMVGFQELAEEAFHDLLKKHHRPITLKEALRQSMRLCPANDDKPSAPKISLRPLPAIK